MKYIRSEQFLEADNKVQDAIYKWWKPEEGDLCLSNIIDEICCIRGELTKERVETITGNTTPLLTVGQLIEFIEDTTKHKIEYLIRKDRGFYEFQLYNYIEDTYLIDCENWCDTGTVYMTWQSDLLQALWIMAQEIAMGI